MFKILKTDYFQLWVLYKSDLRISTTGKQKYELSELNAFKLLRKDNIFP